MDNKSFSPIFFKLTKVDTIQGIVEGVATADVPDKSGEICDYESTVPYYKAWSAEFEKATNGKSLGNIRAMHQPIAAGKVIKLDFDDVKKEIRATGQIIDKAELEKLAAGLYTGFSQGGEYVKRWQDPDDSTLTRYTANPTEISIVDNPCLGAATFDVVKADGTTEVRKFHTTQSDKSPADQSDKASDGDVEQVWKCKNGETRKTKREAIKRNQEIDAEEIASRATAGIAKLIGDIHDSLDKREFSDEERAKAADAKEALPDGSFPIKSEQDLKNAIRAVGRAKDPAKAKEHIISRAKAMDLTHLLPSDWEGSTTDSKKAEKAKVLKSLFDVARVAHLILELNWVQESIEFEASVEEDDSPQPDHLADIVKELCDFLTALVEEECGELVEDKGGTGIENPIATELLEMVAKLPASHAAALGKYLKAGKFAEAVKKAEDLGFEAHQQADGGHPHMDRVHAIHKCAGAVMQHCMKAMHEMHTEDGEEEDDAEKLVKSITEAADHIKKAHTHGKTIMQHCMKMDSKLEPTEEDDGEAHKLVKMEAVNKALEKTIKDLTDKLPELLKRIDNLERQPAARKGALFDVNPGHETQPGNESAETASSISATIGALRLSPEVQRRISIK